ncbi:MAG: hypothetical protein II537_04410 [Bacteroidales bacterium]|nr:hypothetical protein [Bacteroidales bacterium]
MKYLSIASLVLAGGMIMGCSQESLLDLQPEPPSGNVVIRTATISMEGEEPTRALTEHGVKTFEVGDKIAVIYQNNEGFFTKAEATLATGDITDGGKSAKITVTLTNPKADGSVRYYYPSSMVWDNGNENYDPLYSEQDGTLGKITSNFDYAKFEGTLAGTELPSGTLANLLAICKFTIKDGESTDITNQLTRLTIKNGSDVYFITPSSLDNIWVALRPISSGNIDIYAAKTWALYKKTVTGNPTLAANTLTPITVTAPQVPGALSGLFSINDSHDLVYFSQGNLQAQWDGTNSYWTWKFADYQHEYIQNFQANVRPDNPENGDKIDLFGWSALYCFFGISKSKDDDDYSGPFFDWGWSKILNGGGNTQWRTPSESEFDYILNWRPSENHIAGVYAARYIRVQLGAAGDAVKGIVLFPDHFILPALEHSTITWNDINEENSPGVILHWEDWGKMEAAGAVFLPAAGYRKGNEVTLVWENYPEGYYWTSTQGSGENADDCGRALEFGKCQIDPDEYSIEIDDHLRHAGYSVRLIGPWIEN